jgi:hypothetical protein
VVVGGLTAREFGGTRHVARIGRTGDCRWWLPAGLIVGLGEADKPPAGLLREEQRLPVSTAGTVPVFS